MLEGVTMRWLSTVTADDAGSLTIEKMRLDDAGFPQPTGEFEELSADCARRADGHHRYRPRQEGGPRHRRVAARNRPRPAVAGDLRP
jgi:hypothetical protein